jgi:hypothetical protein
MIQLLHMRDPLFAISDNNVLALAAEKFASGGYEAVAYIDAETLDRAFEATQNGALSDSWSRSPPNGVAPIEPRTIEHNGVHYGRRSTMVGDIVQSDGQNYVVMSCGFAVLLQSDRTAPCRVPTIGDVSEHDSPGEHRSLFDRRRTEGDSDRHRETKKTAGSSYPKLANRERRQTEPMKYLGRESHRRGF